MTRHGVGKLQSTSGANYGLFIEVHLYVRPRRNSTIAGTENLPCGKAVYSRGRNLSADRERLYKTSVTGCRSKAGDVLLSIT
jgi:hypothetical protein